MLTVLGIYACCQQVHEEYNETMKRVEIIFIVLILGAGYAFGQGYESAQQFGIEERDRTFASDTIDDTYARSDLFSTDTRPIPNVPETDTYTYYGYQEPDEYFYSPTYRNKSSYIPRDYRSASMPYYLSAAGVTYPPLYPSSPSAYNPGFIDAAQNAANPTVNIPSTISTPYD